MIRLSSSGSLSELWKKIVQEVLCDGSWSTRQKRIVHFVNSSLSRLLGDGSLSTRQLCSQRRLHWFNANMKPLGLFGEGSWSTPLRTVLYRYRVPKKDTERRQFRSPSALHQEQNLANSRIIIIK